MTIKFTCVNRNIIFLVLVFGIWACNPSIIMKSSTDPELVKNIDFLYPISDIGFIESDDKAVYNDSMSKESSRLVFKTLDNNRKIFKLGDYFEIEDSSTNNRIRKEIKELLTEIIYTRNIYDPPYPHSIDSLFSRKGNRFCQIIYCWGFVRSKKNFTSQRVEDILLTSMSLGKLIKYSIKQKSVMIILIFDTVNKKITFCKANEELKSPLNRETYKNHFLKILSGYIL